MMAPESEKNCENAHSPPTSVDITKTMRYPRWSRQETMVLIEAKKVVENATKGICRYSSTSIPVTASLVYEPKWDMVSSFCKKRGVNREPCQCRKRWSNLLSDFKKIKNWESSKKEEDKSFWVMTKDEKKENKLPGFYDGELYNVLEGGEYISAAAFPLTTFIDMRSRAENAAGEEEETEAEEATEEEIIELNTTRKKVITPLSAVRETIMRGSVKEMPKNPLPPSVLELKQIQVQPTWAIFTDKIFGSTQRRKKPVTNPFGYNLNGNGEGSSRGRDGVSEGGVKRKRLSPENCEDTTQFNNKIIKVLKKNSRMLKAHVEAQNINRQLEREQQKEHTDNVVAALGRLTDALTKIADKL
ncbi:trihelix transcription factor ASR3-like [Senna tora]|uniref:Trihelix transcription factor ASR3-like n=1 Tax=Senna tora TaxID=362788 RepID=A0A835CFG5_9FABA|nr:trihelix transcription factor ASR3-like [Senna tora]